MSFRPTPKSIPVYLFNEHNEAYYFWHKARHEGYLSRALDIYHIDAHSDMDTIQKLGRSLHWNEKGCGEYLQHYREIADKELNIANFIIPAVLNGMIRNIYFIYPEWRKFKRKLNKTNVASAFGDGLVLKHGLKIADSEKVKMQFAYPDLTEYGYIRTDIGQIPANRKVILDIDLDYFACTDSITNSMSYELAITADQYQNRMKFKAENPSMQYTGVEIGFKKKGHDHYAMVSFKKVENNSYLPTEPDIRKEVDRVVRVLSDKKIQPVVITICRSCVSGYCPSEYFQLIENYLLQQLRSSYPAITVAS